MNLNKVFLIGRLTSDPQIRSTPSGQAVATLGLATNRIWTNKAGARQDETEYHSVVVWGRQAEIVGQFLHRGSLVFVEGRLQTRSWQDAQGQKRKTTEIVADRIQFGPRGGSGGGFGSGDGERSVSSDGAGGPRRESAKGELGDDGGPEQIPDISLDDDDIKPEDIPF